MANETVNELPSRAKTYAYVFDRYKEQSEQLFALASSLLAQVEPDDQDNPEEGVNHTAWRLAQIMCEMLSSTALETSCRDVLMHGMKRAA